MCMDAQMLRAQDAHDSMEGGGRVKQDARTEEQPPQKIKTWVLPTPPHPQGPLSLMRASRAGRHSCVPAHQNAARMARMLPRISPRALEVARRDIPIPRATGVFPHAALRALSARAAMRGRAIRG
jgi:hypothetical protein